MLSPVNRVNVVEGLAQSLVPGRAGDTELCLT